MTRKFAVAGIVAVLLASFSPVRPLLASKHWATHCTRPDTEPLFHMNFCAEFIHDGRHRPRVINVSHVCSDARPFLWCGDILGHSLYDQGAFYDGPWPAWHRSCRGCLNIQLPKDKGKCYETGGVVEGPVLPKHRVEAWCGAKRVWATQELSVYYYSIFPLAAVPLPGYHVATSIWMFPNGHTISTTRITGAAIL